MRLIYFFLILLPITFASYAADNLAVTDIFPKPSELEGGSSAWIFSGVTLEEKNKSKLYTADYTYYSKKGQKILDIQRNNSYSVSVRVFATENFLNALQLYEKLANVKVKSKKQIAPVSFGERGVMLVLPNEKDKSNQANFYLTFLLRSFVVQVYADDGFALMDMAGFVEHRLIKYTMQNAKSYFINKINLITTIDNKEVGVDTVTFTGDNITKVTITGKVFDKFNNPVANAEISSRQTGQKTKTDIRGEYKLEVTAGKGREIALNKVIFLPISIYADSKISSGFYEVTTKYKDNRTVEELFELNVKQDKIDGKLYYDNRSQFYNVTGSIDKDSLVFIKDCSQKNSTFDCRQKFAATIDNKSIVKGKWVGAGGGGTWSLDKGRYAIQSLEFYPNDIGVKFSQVMIEGGKLIEVESDKFHINDGKRKSFIYFTLPKNIISDTIFFEKGELRLTKLASKSKPSKLILYELVRLDKGVELKNIATLATLNANNEEEVITFPISSQLRQPNMSGYLIGLKDKAGTDYFFDEDSVKLTLLYYQDMKHYVPKKDIVAKLSSLKGADFVSNSNGIKGDDVEDIEIDVEFNVIGKTLEYVEIISNGKQVRRWNTNPYDIYPAVAVVIKGSTLNEDNGAISFHINKETSKVKLYIYKGSIDKDDKFSIKVMLDGKVYESAIE